MSTGNLPTRADPAPRPGAQTRTRRGEVARRRAMEAAISAIAELGADRVRMVDIAARAGMSTGHILYYFGRKDGLLLQALGWSEQDLNERLRAALAGLRTPRRKLARFVELYLPTGPSDPRWVLWTQLLARPPEDEPSRQMLDSFGQAWQAQLADIVHEGIRRKMFTAVDVDEFVLRSRAMLDGLSLDILMGSLRLGRDEALAFALRAMERDLRVTSNDQGT